jgi:endonuclease YncB( thermonuclease family)
MAVADGDTLTLLTPAKTQVKVRLDQIDAPEKNQPFGDAAKRGLSDLVFDRTVEVTVRGQDRYGRTLGEVRARGTDVNAAMVAAGQAWAYRDYLRDERMLTLERQARVARNGLWALPDDQIEAPWEWRAGRRAEGRPNLRRTSVRAAGPVATCGTKRTCKAMNSCAEARRQLQCGVAGLDGDGDGTPCERLCRAA